MLLHCKIKNIQKIVEDEKHSLILYFKTIMEKTEKRLKFFQANGANVEHFFHFSDILINQVYLSDWAGNFNEWAEYFIIKCRIGTDSLVQILEPAELRKGVRRIFQV